MRRTGFQLLGLSLIAIIAAVLVVPVIANGNRICFAPGAVRAAVFMEPDRVEVYTINNQDRGELQMSFTQAYLITLPGRPTENLLLGKSDINIHVEMWRLTNGMYLVLAGPDGENKMHECIFGGSRASVRTYTDLGQTPVGVPFPTDLPFPGAPTDPAATEISTQEPTIVPTEPADPTPVGTREVTFGE